MAVETQELPDGLIIQGSPNHSAPRFTGGFLLHGHADHRIVMAAALAALAVDGEITVDTAEAMDVTFPNFVELMQSIGADMELME